MYKSASAFSMAFLNSGIKKEIYIILSFFVRLFVFPNVDL